MSFERFKRIGALAALTALSQVPGDLGQRFDKPAMSQATSGKDEESSATDKKVVGPEGRDSTEKNRALLTGLLRFIKVLESLPDPRLSTVSSEAGSPAVSENDSESTSAEDTEDAEPGPRDSELSEEERAAKGKLKALIQEKFPDMKFKITNSAVAEEQEGPTHVEFSFHGSGDDGPGMHLRPEEDGTFSVSDWVFRGEGETSVDDKELAERLRDFYDDGNDQQMAAETHEFFSYMYSSGDPPGHHSDDEWKIESRKLYKRLNEIREKRKQQR